MNLVLQQEKKECLEAVQTLCKAEKITLETVAERMGGEWTYQKLYHRLSGKMVEVELLEQIVKAVQGNRKGRRVSLVNYSEVTIVTAAGLRIKLIGDEQV